jgi:hypothetical protein
MISSDTARKLKAAGVVWTPSLHDFFMIPERGMDERIFVISDMLVTVDTLRGELLIMFQGASEWALDSLLTRESVWLPTEEQLRLLLEAMFIHSGIPEIVLSSRIGGCTCTCEVSGERYRFESQSASEAYAEVLIFFLGRAQASYAGEG